MADSPLTKAWIEGPCPQCGLGWRCPATDRERPSCSACGAPASALHSGGVGADGSLQACLACGHDQMYWARDFPRGLGIGVVIVAAVLAPFTWYLSLAVGAVVDSLLVFVVPKRVHCYRCNSIHHGFVRPEVWKPFQLEVSDLHQYGEKAAVAKMLGGGHTLPHARRGDGAPRGPAA